MSRGSLRTEMMRAQRRVDRAQRLLDKMKGRTNWLKEASRTVPMPFGHLTLRVVMNDPDQLANTGGFSQFMGVSVQIADADARLERIVHLIEANTTLEKLARDAEKPILWDPVKARWGEGV